MPVLVPMSEAEYEVWLAAAIPAYAADKVAAGQWAKEESLELSRMALLDLLPQGRRTANNYLFNILDEQAGTVGTAWIAAIEQAGRPIAYICDVRVRPECRRKGHATRALAAIEDEARRLGVCGIGLHVFGHNAGAQALYEKLGYRPTNISMFKEL